MQKIFKLKNRAFWYAINAYQLKSIAFRIDFCQWLWKQKAEEQQVVKAYMDGYFILEISIELKRKKDYIQRVLERLKDKLSRYILRHKLLIDLEGAG